MRNNLFILVAFVAMATLSSCKKDYTCSCTILGTTTDSVLEKQKKADAEAACNEADAAAKLFAGSCTLK